MRGLEACGQSIDMAGEDGGRREGIDQHLQVEYRHVPFLCILHIYF